VINVIVGAASIAVGATRALGSTHDQPQTVWLSGAYPIFRYVSNLPCDGVSDSSHPSRAGGLAFWGIPEPARGAACLDDTECRFHIGGQLGAGICEMFPARGPNVFQVAAPSA